mmetsp:Transcript_25125/g.63727  ORF Transcript_25125/g.63727 Transcript_25125/m.63727 type:complete len:256 (+) Transcript_25125:565-1332(+)
MPPGRAPPYMLPARPPPICESPGEPGVSGSGPSSSSGGKKDAGSNCGLASPDSDCGSVVMRRMDAPSSPTALPTTPVCSSLSVRLCLFIMFLHLDWDAGAARERAASLRARRASRNPSSRSSNRSTSGSTDTPAAILSRSCTNTSYICEWRNAARNARSRSLRRCDSTNAACSNTRPLPLSASSWWLCALPPAPREVLARSLPSRLCPLVLPTSRAPRGEGMAVAPCEGGPCPYGDMTDAQCAAAAGLSSWMKRR